MNTIYLIINIVAVIAALILGISDFSKKTKVTILLVAIVFALLSNIMNYIEVNKKDKELILKKNHYSVSHLSIDIPIRLLDINGRIIISLEKDGAIFSVIDKSKIRRIMYKQPEELKHHELFTCDEKSILVGIYRKGYKYIYHNFRIDQYKSYFQYQNKKPYNLHLEMIFIPNLEIKVLNGEMRILNPQIPYKEYMQFNNDYNIFINIPSYIIVNKNKSFTFDHVVVDEKKNVVILFQRSKESQ